MIQTRFHVSRDEKFHKQYETSTDTVFHWPLNLRLVFFLQLGWTLEPVLVFEIIFKY